MSNDLKSPPPAAERPRFVPPPPKAAPKMPSRKGELKQLLQLCAKLELKSPERLVLAAEDRAAPPVDPRQLPLLAPVAPVVATHTSTRGLSVATITGNDNATSPAKPERERARTRPVDAATLDALKTRLADAVAAGQTVKSVAAVAGVNDSGLIQWRKGATGLGPTVAGKLDAALSKLGF